MTNSTDQIPRVWPACLNCYNSGSLVGCWVDSTDAENVTLAQLHESAGGPYADCEQIWCLDTDCLPVDREMDLLEAAQWGRAFIEVGLGHWPALCAWGRSGAYVAEGVGEIPTVSDFEERYCGRWEDFREYAENLGDDTGLTMGWPQETVT